MSLSKEPKQHMILVGIGIPVYGKRTFSIDRWGYSKRQRRPEDNRDVDPRGVYSFKSARMRP
jgi:hypothetical protein